jgi:hypothetical protein
VGQPPQRQFGCRTLNSWRVFCGASTQSFETTDS